MVRDKNLLGYPHLNRTVNFRMSRSTFVDNVLACVMLLQCSLISIWLLILISIA